MTNQHENKQTCLSKKSFDCYRGFKKKIEQKANLFASPTSLTRVL